MRTSLKADRKALRRTTSGGVMDRLLAVDPRLVDSLVAVALAGGLQLQLALKDHPGSLAVDVIGGLLLTLPLVWRRRAPLTVVTIYVGTSVLSEALGGGLFAGAPPPVGAIAAGVVAFYSLGLYGEGRSAGVGAILGVAGLWIAVIASGETDFQSFLFSGGLVVVTPWLAGRTSRSRRLRAADLAREQEQRARLAASNERARIAREFHDVVAHSVGVIVVQAQGARRVLERDPDRAREALATIEQTGRRALAEMRRSLGVLRLENGEAALEPQPGMKDLDALVEQARQSGLTVEVTVEGKRRPLPQGVDLSAYRIVQEALTNTIKHAGPVRTRITVLYRERELELEISDDGPGPAGDGAGHGLVGMRERVALYDGELRAGPGPRGGFVVRARIPLTT